MNKIIRGLKDPYRVCDFLLRKFAPLIKNDKTYVKWHYYFNMHKRLNLDNPKTFNEKLSWLKLNARDYNYSRLVDKFAVKDYVKGLVGDKCIIPTLGVWDNFDDIDFNALPSQFVLKCTHDSGGLVICKDKSSLDINAAKLKIEKALGRSYYKLTREYPYKNVKPRIIAELYIVDESGTELKDYKFFCFDGIPKMMFVATGRPVNTCFDFYDMDFNHLDIRQGHPNAEHKVKKPKGFDEMKRIAAELSKGFPQLRVDFYDVNGHVYFGELTFFHFGGDTPFDPEKWDRILGEWITLPMTKGV